MRLLEAVNYFEHWGLARTQRRVRPVDSWDTHSWFTFYGLIGLSRHADHHAWPARPYQQLRVWPEAPVLPFGYVGMVDLVIGKNAEFQRLAAHELGRRRLGPFTPENDGETAEPLASNDAEARLVEAQKEAGDYREPAPVAWWKRLLVVAGIVLVSAFGVHWESGGAEMAFAARAALHAWIFGVFVFVLWSRARIQDATGQEALSWGLGFGLLWLLGSLTQSLVA